MQVVEKDIHTEKAKQVLEEFVKNEEDKIAKVESERVLEYWREGRL